MIIANRKFRYSHISGYVARKASMRFAWFLKDKKPFICTFICISTLLLSPSDPIPERHGLIELRSKSYLKHPSLKLCTLIDVLETAVMNVVKNDKIVAETFLNGSKKLHDLSPLPFVGYKEHLEQLNRWIITFYRTTRMNSIRKQWNQNNSGPQRTIEKPKLSKSSTAQGPSENIGKEPEMKMRSKGRKRRADCGSNAIFVEDCAKKRKDISNII